MRDGLAGTGVVITSAALIMVCVFASFVLSDEPVIKMMGLGLAVAVAVDATVIRGLLVPAVMALLGGANWWSPRRRRRPAAEDAPPPLVAAGPGAAAEPHPLGPGGTTRPRPHPGGPARGPARRPGQAARSGGRASRRQGIPAAGHPGGPG